MFLSIIIPTYNEEKNITVLINYLQDNTISGQFEIIVSDGGSTDKTAEVAAKLGVKVLISDKKGRSGQMNFGAKHASGNILFFVHADCLPTPDFFYLINKSIEKGFDSGSFRTKFNSRSFLLRINSFFTRFNFLFFRGGDQGIFVTKKLWDEIGGYNDRMLIMEDYDFIEKLWKLSNFKLIPASTLVSARKFENNSWLKVQLANHKIIKMYKNKAPQAEMIATYGRMLNHLKNAF